MADNVQRQVERIDRALGELVADSRAHRTEISRRSGRIVANTRTIDSLLAERTRITRAAQVAALEVAAEALARAAAAAGPAPIPTPRAPASAPATPAE